MLIRSPEPLYENGIHTWTGTFLNSCMHTREQLVRPKQRRSLMRRALAEIVPDED